jgi:hypothetical protein
MERVPTASEKALTRIPGAASLALLLAALVPVGVCPGCGNVNCRLRPARQI